MRRIRYLSLWMALLAPLPANTLGQTLDARVDAAVARLTQEIVELRHRIHQNPELSNREFQTAALVAKHLHALRMEVRTGIAHTGVVGLLKGGRPGPVVAVRADMDALPITEDTPYPFKSTARATYNAQEVGVMHACGHDIHTAVMLGVASVLAPLREQIPGTVMFIFQPAEEGAPAGEEGGAQLMLKEGVFQDPRPTVVFGLHSDANLEVGKVGYTSGPTNAASANFKIILHGQSAHAAWPHLAVDPVVMSAQAVLALQTIRARNISPFEPSVLTIAKIHGGVRGNIIPAEVALEGTVRVFDAKVQDVIERRMREILEGVARGAGGSYTLQFTRNAPVNISDPNLVDRMLPTIARTVGAANVMPVQPWMAGDDFARFAAEAPAFFFHLGTVKPSTASGNNHTPTFMADDDAIPVGMRVMSNVVLDYLSAGVR